MTDSIEEFLIWFWVTGGAWLLFVLVRPSYKRRKHDRNIKNSKQVLDTIRTIRGPLKEARIFTYIRKISPYVYEELLLTTLENAGVKIKRSQSYSGDGGIDGEFYFNGRLFALQAKRYSKHISRQHIKAFINKTKHYDGGLFIHTGKTGRDIWKECPRNILILSGQQLIDFLLGQKPLDALLKMG